MSAPNRADSIAPLRPPDVTETVVHIVTCDRRVTINEVLVRAAEQTW